MKNITQVTLEKYKDNPRYELIEGNIYKNLKETTFDANHVFALSYELEEEEDSQYPLEDILDKFYLHASDFIDEDNFDTSTIVNIELGGTLEDIKNAISSIIGKRVFNSDYIGEDGQTYVKLNIE